MTRQIEYYLAIVSPWAYLGSGRLSAMSDKHSVPIDVRPVNLGAVFGETGGLPLPKRAPARQAYRMAELRRWSEFLGIPINLQPKHFPADETLAAHMTLAARARGDDALALTITFGKACWEQERDLADKDTLIAIAGEAGLDGGSLCEAAGDPVHTAEREKLTNEAIGKNVIGSPGYVFDGEFYWGQDRLDFLERAVAG